MTPDRRFWRANARVAHPDLEGQVSVPLVSPGRRRIARPVVDLCAAPGGPRDKNMVFGQAFELLEEADGWAFGYDPRDGYVG